MSNLLDLNLGIDNELISQNAKDKQLLNNPLLQKDIWRTVEDLKLRVLEHRKVNFIDFQLIKQDWLKLLTKLYILIRSQRNLSAAYLKNDIHYLNIFSQFIQQKSIFSLEQINNYLFE